MLDRNCNLNQLRDRMMPTPLMVGGPWYSLDIIMLLTSNKIANCASTCGRRKLLSGMVRFEGLRCL